MSKESHKKLALEDLMARAEQRSGDKKAYKQVYFSALDGELVFEMIPLPRVLAMMDRVESDTMIENLDFQVNLIYQCCPILRNHALQEAYNCKEPTDIVCAVFEDNLGTITQASEAILGFYGMEDKKDAVKN